MLSQSWALPILLTAIISSIGSVLVNDAVAYLKNRNSEESLSEQATRQAVKLMLMDKTRYLTKCAVRDKGITISQRALILQMVDTAHALGANGEMTACANEVNSLPTIPELGDKS